MDLQKILEMNGLTSKEAAVYLSLLELQQATPSTIARRSNIKRPTAYVILDTLKKKGLVSYVKKNKLLYYRITNPHSLVEEQQNRYQQLEKALPELILLHGRFGITPTMTIYEGKEGIIQIMEDTLKTSTELLCWADATLAVETLLLDYYPKYIETKVKRKVSLRGILSYDKRALLMKRNGQKEFREVYLIPKQKFPFKNEINIYDNKIAIISYADKIGIIIENQNIADTQRSIFNFAFEYAKIVESQILTSADKKYLNQN